MEIRYTLVVLEGSIVVVVVDIVHVKKFFRMKDIELLADLGKVLSQLIVIDEVREIVKDIEEFHEDFLVTNNQRVRQMFSGKAAIGEVNPCRIQVIQIYYQGVNEIESRPDDKVISDPRIVDMLVKEIANLLSGVLLRKSVIGIFTTPLICPLIQKRIFIYGLIKKNRLILCIGDRTIEILEFVDGPLLNQGILFTKVSIGRD